jgi:hypothetical protein
MIYRKGELSPAMIDRGWPYQVALPACASQGGGYTMIHEFCKDLSLCPRGHSVFHGDEWLNVYCFAEPADAEKFLQRFGGETFDPKQRGKGSNWARWKK